jgi:hypothetical protein
VDVLTTGGADVGGSVGEAAFKVARESEAAQGMLHAGEEVNATLAEARQRAGGLATISGCTDSSSAVGCDLGFHGSFEVDPDFVDPLRKLGKYAHDHGITIEVTQSIRQVYQKLNKPAVTPSLLSNHLVDEAIDAKFVIGGVTYDKDNLKSSVPGPLLDLANYWEGLGKGFRWGGRFRQERDPIHFDYDLADADIKLYEKKFNQRQPTTLVEYINERLKNPKLTQRQRDRLSSALSRLLTN